jgi:hypothetical protein
VLYLHPVKEKADPLFEGQGHGPEQVGEHKAEYEGHQDGGQDRDGLYDDPGPEKDQQYDADDKGDGGDQDQYIPVAFSVFVQGSKPPHKAACGARPFSAGRKEMSLHVSIAEKHKKGMVKKEQDSGRGVILSGKTV